MKDDSWFYLFLFSRNKASLNNDKNNLRPNSYFLTQPVNRNFKLGYTVTIEKLGFFLHFMIKRTLLYSDLVVLPTCVLLYNLCLSTIVSAFFFWSEAACGLLHSLKFLYSEKAIKIWCNLPRDLEITFNEITKTLRKIASNLCGLLRKPEIYMSHCITRIVSIRKLPLGVFDVKEESK